MVFKIDRYLERMSKEIWGDRGGTLYCYIKLELTTKVHLWFLYTLLFIFVVTLKGLPIPNTSLLLTEYYFCLNFQKHIYISFP